MCGDSLSCELPLPGALIAKERQLKVETRAPSRNERAASCVPVRLEQREKELLAASARGEVRAAGAFRSKSSAWRDCSARAGWGWWLAGEPL